MEIPYTHPRLATSGDEKSENRLVETLAHNIPPEIERAQCEEVRRRMGQLESGEVRLIPGAQALDLSD